MRDFIVDALSEIDVVSDDLQNAECIGNPVKELLVRYLQGRKDGLESVLEFLNTPPDPENPETETLETPESESENPDTLVKFPVKKKEILSISDDLIGELESIEERLSAKQKKLVKDWVQTTREFQDEFALAFGDKLS